MSNRVILSRKSSYNVHIKIVCIECNSSNVELEINWVDDEDCGSFFFQTVCHNCGFNDYRQYKNHGGWQ